MTSSITPLVAMQGTLEKMADKFKEALPFFLVQQFMAIRRFFQ